MPKTVVSDKKTVARLLVLLLMANISQLFVPWGYSWLVVAMVTGLLALIAWKGGLGLNDVGLSKHSVRKGVLWGALAAVLIALVSAVAYKLGRSLFLDSRYHNQLHWAVFLALVVIPLHTVLLEELAFRGVLWGALRRIKDTRFATIVSSVIFGLWHVAPSINVNHSSQNVARFAGSNASGDILSIAGIVLVTTAAGLALCELRRRSDSLIAPILAHWAINGVAIILAALAWAH